MKNEERVPAVFEKKERTKKNEKGGIHDLFITGKTRNSIFTRLQDTVREDIQNDVNVTSANLSTVPHMSSCFL